MTVAEPRTGGVPSTEEIRSFWAETRAELDHVPLDAHLEQIESSDPLMAVWPAAPVPPVTYRVRMASFEGRHIRAWFSVPAGQPPAHGWPGIMEVPGYNGTHGLPIHLLQYGYATLSLFPRSQGDS